MTIQFKPGDRSDSFGYHFIIGLSGPTLSDSDKRALEKIKPAGIILFARNFDTKVPYPQWLSALDRLITEAKAYAECDELIVSIDHEGGRVHRPPAPLTKFPAAASYAGSAVEVASAMALELKSIGVNVNWAPVCDIHSNPKNPVIGDRSFGETAKKVSDAAVAFAEGLQKGEILCCAKHFPGHGDTETDSHHELPLLNLTEEELARRELLPFEAMIEWGVPFVMTAHILFPNIDQYCPATLSLKIIDGILRGKLGFGGIVVSDDLEMKAVAEGFRSENVIGQALNAGCEMFIVARHPEGSGDKALELAGNFGRCLGRRALSEDQLHQTYLRIESLFKIKLSFHKPAAVEAEILEAHAELARRLS